MSDNEIVIYRRGQEHSIQKRMDLPPIVQLVVLDDLQVAINRLNRHLEKQEFTGEEYSHDLACTEQEQVISITKDWPFMPYVRAHFWNYGPDKAYVAVNYNGDWIPLVKGAQHNVDHTGADERIQRIYYKCDPGETASVQVVGKY